MPGKSPNQSQKNLFAPVLRLLTHKTNQQVVSFRWLFMSYQIPALRLFFRFIRKKRRYYYDISASEFDLLSESVDIYYGGSVDLHAIYGYEGHKQKCTFEHPAFTSWTEVKKAIGEQKYINGIEDSWKMEFFIGIHGDWFVNLGIKMGVEISNVPFK